MLDIKSAKDVLNKLRPPLSLATMREYFKQLSSGEDSANLMAQKEEDFQKTHVMSDSDTWAFAVLSEYFKMRLRKLQTFQKQQTQTLTAKAKKTKTSHDD